MGNTRSELFEPVSVDLWWNNDQASTSRPEVAQANQHTINKANEATMEEIKHEISSLHEKRRRIIAEKKKEMDGLRQELALHKKQNEELKGFIREKGYEPPIQEWDTTKVDVSLQTETFEVPGSSNPSEDPQTRVQEVELQLGKLESIKGKNLELQINIAELQKELQGANSEMAAFENERKEYKTHVTALKDIIAVSKQLLLMREVQIKELTQKVAEIQASLAEKELQAFSEDLRQEYERQLQNIKQLRVLYEERQRVEKTERDRLKSQLEEAQSSLKTQETKNGELQERVEELETDNSKKYDTIISLESQLGLTKAECGELKAETSVINQLFSQILLDFNNGQEIDMDKLIKNLEENHDLLTEMVINEESNELSSALPKVLLDLVSQVNEKTRLSPSTNPQEESNSAQGLALATIAEESESQNSTQQNSLSSASEIVQNLPKVWKVLTELLSHQSAPVSVLNENQADADPCYKSVQTPTGPALVLSVSKTYIRLKDLIVEKKSLEKETTRLKQLNTHLETRLQDQEKRLEMVSHELSKTWNVVGKMQKQHQQLHTQEKILRYELAQKRKLLNELKEELEYCREKWLQAREKNSTTEEQWKQLRNEFAARKNTISEDLNNSVESGYSDERESSSSDDDIEDEAASPVAASPEPVPGCSSVVKNVETGGVSLCEPTDAIVVEEEPNQESSNAEGSGQAILKVIKDEIAKIENSSECSGTGSFTQIVEDVQTNMEINQQPEDLAQTVSELGDVSTQPTTSNENTTDCLANETESNQSSDHGVSTSADYSSLESAESNQLEAGVTVLEPSLQHNTMNETVLNRLETEADTENVSLTSSNCCLPLGMESNQLKELDVTSTKEDCVTVEDLSPSSSSSTIIDKGSSPTSQNEIRILSPDHQEEGLLAESSELAKTEEDGAIVLSEDGNAEQVHSFETLKTDLVQTEEVQTDANEAYRSHEQLLAAKEKRLKRLEEQAKNLITQTTNTSNRSVEMCTRLDNLHEQYGGDQKTRRKDIDDMYKKLEEDILQTIKKTQGGEEYPSTSRQNRSTEDLLAAREERLKRLEEQSNALANQTARTSHKGKEISSKLDSLHQHFGEDSKAEEVEDSPIEEEPSTSSRTSEEVLARREERLQQMEQQAQQLVSKARRNSFRNLQFYSKLSKLHDRYGDSSDSSDDGADDNNNNDADGVEEVDETQNGNVSVNNEAQIELEEENTQRGEGEEQT